MSKMIILSQQSRILNRNIQPDPLQKGVSDRNSLFFSYKKYRTSSLSQTGPNHVMKISVTKLTFNDFDLTKVSNSSQRKNSSTTIECLTREKSERKKSQAIQKKNRKPEKKETVPKEAERLSKSKKKQTKNILKISTKTDKGTTKNPIKNSPKVPVKNPEKTSFEYSSNIFDKEQVSHSKEIKSKNISLDNDTIDLSSNGSKSIPLNRNDLSQSAHEDKKGDIRKHGIIGRVVSANKDRKKENSASQRVSKNKMLLKSGNILTRLNYIGTKQIEKSNSESKMLKSNKKDFSKYLNKVEVLEINQKYLSSSKKLQERADKPSQKKKLSHKFNPNKYSEIVYPKTDRKNHRYKIMPSSI